MIKLRWYKLVKIVQFLIKSPNWLEPYCAVLVYTQVRWAWHLQTTQYAILLNELLSCWNVTVFCSKHQIYELL